MPNWQPNWEDVRWNWGASDQARDALYRMAGWLDGAADHRQRLAEETLAQWEGGRAREFADRARWAVANLHTLADRCRRNASALDRASQAAREDQARRQAERARWYAERAEELRDLANDAWHTVSGRRP
jgi:hypothetical protein